MSTAHDDHGHGHHDGGHHDDGHHDAGHQDAGHHEASYAGPRPDDHRRASHDPNGIEHHPAPPDPHAAKAQPNRGRKRFRGGAAPLPPLKESDYLSLDPDVQQQLSDRIDLYYNNPLDIFPFDAQMRKPDRFHVMFENQIAERFPDDADTRGRIVSYGRVIFRALFGYMLFKRALQFGALAALAILASQGPILFASLSPEPVLRVLATVGGMLLVPVVFVLVMAIVFTQYRTALENRSYELSREIVQRTRELQNLFTTVKAMPDQAETQFQMDGPGWGKRSALLMRLLMWVAARLEYLEKFTQVEMWRVGRERYWMNWGGGILGVLTTAAGFGILALEPAPNPADQTLFRVLQGLAAVIGLGISWASYFQWRTPVNLVRDKFGSESWIRYATLNVDDSIGDQSRRDKERLVEYRSLTRGR
ncbi:MAG: hypothetical protein K1X35_11185 [Caulobacteraceae bacterium]|nr:hypothetical protein [Caulobacteraceae bacterium]